jgi:hypothetical protein
VEGAGRDALGRLADSVGRPRASLAAFSGLSPQQLTLLADAVEATVERRRTEIDRALSRVFRGPAGAALVRTLSRERLMPWRRVPS